ncbi:MAG: protein phosphatase [Cyanobacteria bacterium]|nr:protein phosphatase [Cyanobacteriota bacterium]
MAGSELQEQVLALQAGLFRFAIEALVRQHRTSFPPLWTAESWAKLLIWLALNSGSGADGAALQQFADALGTPLALRLRRLFFERELEDLNLLIKADPAEPQVLVLPLDPLRNAEVSLGLAAEGLQRTGLEPLVVADRLAWQVAQGLVAIPWL